MSGDSSQQQVQVVCRECLFSKVVQREGEKPARVIIDHGQETGHKLVIEGTESE